MIKRTNPINWRQLWNTGKQLVTRGLQQLETKVKAWTKPAPDRQITGVAADLFRSKQELIAENAFLRQQLIVLKRQNTGRPSDVQSQTWATFLANHAHEIWACDFVQSYDLFFRTIFIFFMVELGSRRVMHFGVTRSPSDAWITQQLREATPLGES